MKNIGKKEIQKKQTEIVKAVSVEDVRDRIIILRDQPVVLDSDVAELYGVQTKEINQAVKNNPQKFPYGYIMTVDEYEKAELVKNFDRFNGMKHSTLAPKALTEIGLYMIATILKC